MTIGYLTVVRKEIIYILKTDKRRQKDVRAEQSEKVTKKATEKLTESVNSRKPKGN